jgi:Skp family chaperone for outer membrane proteins
MFLVSTSAAIAVGQEAEGLSASAPPSGKPVAAYVDINFVFKNHPWTSLTKDSLQTQLKEKAAEIEKIQGGIAVLKKETAELEEFRESLKPFYAESYLAAGSGLLPLPQNKAEDEQIDMISRTLVFGGADIRFNSPIDSAALLEENEAKIAANISQMYEKDILIEQLRFDTKTRVLQEEAVEVQEILEDIYAELKLFALKRNIALIVNKPDILYGQKPFDITAEFTDRLRKTKKEKKSKKNTGKTIIIELDGNKAPEFNKE